MSALHEGSPAMNEFDEAYYLAQNPDVSAAVKAGVFQSGIEHYQKHGKCEGRLPHAKAKISKPDKTPVAFFLYNRPLLTRMTFARIVEYQPSRLFIIADAARFPAENALVEETRAVVENIDWGGKIEWLYADRNMGCKARLVSGLRHVFSKVESAIVIEDDVLVHPDFFHFCHTMLHAYWDDERIMHIAGSNFLAPGTAKPPCWFSRHSDIWGWATWRRAFQHYDADLVSWRRPRFLFTQKWLGDTPFEKRYWTSHFDRIQTGAVDTWDYQWHYTVYRRGGLSVVPYANLVTNLGHGDSATHTRDEHSGIARLKSFQIGRVEPPARVCRNRRFDEETFLRRYAADSMPRLPVEELQISLRPSEPEDLVICHNEISDRHGVGALLKKLLTDRERWSSIRTTTHFEAMGSTRKAVEIPPLVNEEAPCLSTYYRLALELRDRQINQILCVPYSQDEALRGIAAARMTGAPLVVYLMDDQNIYADGIHDDLMRELLTLAHRRFAICHEMSEAYEQKYGIAIETLYPAVALAETIAFDGLAEHRALEDRGVLIGNLWTSDWIRRFAKLLHKTGMEADWYGNAAGRFRQVSDEELEAAGLHLRGFLPQKQMAATLRQYGYALVPTASGETDPSHRWMARLSFPSKIMTLLFSGGLPVLVFADEENPASRFIRESGLGLVVPYETNAFTEAVKQLRDSAWLTIFYDRLRERSEDFSLARADAAIWPIPAQVVQKG